MLQIFSVILSFLRKNLSCHSTPHPPFLHTWGIVNLICDLQIQLPDHDFVIAEKHKLIPSVIGDMQIQSKTFSAEAVTYSGLTYIAVRSAKHFGKFSFSFLLVAYIDTDLIESKLQNVHEGPNLLI